MNIIKSKQLLAHCQIASALLAAISTGAALRIEAGNSFSQDELNHLAAFWQRQLTDVHSEIDSARRLVELATRSGKGPVQP